MSTLVFGYPFGRVSPSASTDPMMSFMKTLFAGQSVSATSRERLEEAADKFEGLLEQIPAEMTDEQERPDPEALREANELLYALPGSIPLPELSLEPRGGIALDWYFEPGRALLASVSGTGWIEFAFLGNGEEHHGRVSYSPRLPKTLSALLQSILC